MRRGRSTTSSSSRGGAGLSRTNERRVRTNHATSQTIYDLDQLQDQLGAGPCIEAAAAPPHGGAVSVDDLAVLEGTPAARWPESAQRAVEAGFRSMLSVSLTGHGHHHRAALNGADQARTLEQAVTRRDVIGQAKGTVGR